MLLHEEEAWGPETAKEAKVKVGFINKSTGLSLMGGDILLGRPNLQTHGYH